MTNNSSLCVSRLTLSGRLVRVLAPEWTVADHVSRYRILSFKKGFEMEVAWTKPMQLSYWEVEWISSIRPTDVDSSAAAARSPKS